MSIKELLKGEKVRLTAFHEDDFSIIEKWYGESGFSRHYDFMPALPRTAGQLKEMIESSSDAHDQCIFAIKENEGGGLIGICGFESIVWNNGTARLYIGLGDKEHRGKGYASEAIRQLVDFGFMELNLHCIQLSVIEYNSSAIKLYERAGFVREGTVREFVCRDSKRFDLYMYGLLRKEWENAEN
jgi:RimJ/RimL family protein N-acetyltransferase